MRARLAVLSSGVRCELREILLRDKAPEFLAASPSATVPALATFDGTVIDESLDIMLWALRWNDPEQLLSPALADLSEMLTLINENDNEFKSCLDRYKYPNRFPEENPIERRDRGLDWLRGLDERLASRACLFGEGYSLADLAILPFVRQFAHVDRTWFDDAPIPHARRWLLTFKASERFAKIMLKYEKWEEGAKSVFFPDTAPPAVF